jgi:hypothetical protein
MPKLHEIIKYIPPRIEKGVSTSALYKICSKYNNKTKEGHAKATYVVLQVCHTPSK